MMLITIVKYTNEEREEKIRAKRTITVAAPVRKSENMTGAKRAKKICSLGNVISFTYKPITSHLSALVLFFPLCPVPEANETPLVEKRVVETGKGREIFTVGPTVFTHF